MKKIFFFVVATTMLITALTGCGMKGTESGPACKDVLNSVKEETDYGFDTVYGWGDKIYDSSYENLYAISKDLVDDGAIMYKTESGYADEISLLHIKRSSDVDLAKEKLQQRIEDRKNVFSGYKSEEVSKLDNAIVFVNKNYVCLIIAEDPDMVKATVNNTIDNSAKKEAQQ